MSEITRATIRRVARTTEYFIVGQIAKKIPPTERLFLVFELDPKKKKNHDPRVERARKKHERGGYCIDTCVLAILTREQLKVVLGDPAWVRQNVSENVNLASNQARCVLLSDDEREPRVVLLTARAVNRPVPPDEDEASADER